MLGTTYMVTTTLLLVCCSVDHSRVLQLTQASLRFSFSLTVFSADLQCHFLKEDWSKQITLNQCCTFAMELKQNSFLWIHPTSEVKTFNNITKIAPMFHSGIA